MKKLLLIEDDYNKIKNIESFLEKLKNEIGLFIVTIKKSYQSGLDTILNNHYDLLLLDMSMHNFDKSVEESGGEFMQFAGEDILSEMSWNEISIKTIIVTQYDLIGNKSLAELKEFWEKQFADNYLGTVYYSANETNWKNELSALIRKNL